MRPPAAASSAARSPAPLRRREKSPVKSGEYPASSSRARASGESGSAYPYEYSSSRARPSWRTTEREEEEEEDDDDGLQEEEEEVDVFGLEPERVSRQLDRGSIEPEGIDPDDDPGDDIDLDRFSAYAYANTRRSGPWRDASAFRGIGPAPGREACSRLAEGKGKGKYEGMAQVVPLASISESTAMSRSITTTMPRTRPVGFPYPRRSDSPPPIPAPMGDVIEADEPWSDTYEAFYLTPLPPLSTTTYEVGDLELAEVVRGRRTGRGNYVKKGIVIPPHTTAILIAESANTSPTTTTNTTTAGGTTTGTTNTTSSTNTSTTTSRSTTATHTTTHIPSIPLTPTAITPDDDFDEDEGFSEPTTLEATAAMERERERDLIACMRGGRAAAMRGLAMGMGEGVGDVGRGGGGGGVVRPRVRKRISKRKGGRRDGGGGGGGV